MMFSAYIPTMLPTPVEWRTLGSNERFQCHHCNSFLPNAANTSKWSRVRHCNLETRICKQCGMPSSQRAIRTR